MCDPFLTWALTDSITRFTAGDVMVPQVLVNSSWAATHLGGIAKIVGGWPRAWSFQVVEFDPEIHNCQTGLGPPYAAWQFGIRNLHASHVSCPTDPHTRSRRIIPTALVQTGADALGSAATS